MPSLGEEIRECKLDQSKKTTFRPSDLFRTDNDPENTFGLLIDFKLTPFTSIAASYLDFRPFRLDFLSYIFLFTLIWFLVPL